MSTMERILRLMGEKKASDVYLSAHAPALIKINGQCIPINNQLLPPEATRNLLAEVLPPKRIEELEETGELNMAHAIEGVGNFRFSAMRQRGTYAAVIRYITTDIPPLDSLGVPAILGDLIMEKRGLLLMVGATGAGKSTTLAAMMDYRNEKATGHILTIEDPVEYVHPSSMALVNQREVGADCMSFSDALRAALREDPDVVLVGEMRDLETISHTLTLAETGHLVFATLHTNDASQTIDRIIDVFPSDQQEQVRTQLSMSLAAVISQRLIPKIGGGRVAAHEVLVGTSAVGNLIREGKVRQMRNLISTSQRDGMFALEQSLSRLVSGGLISMEDAMEASVHPEDIASLAQRQA